MELTFGIIAAISFSVWFAYLDTCIMWGEYQRLGFWSFVCALIALIISISFGQQSYRFQKEETVKIQANKFFQLSKDPEVWLSGPLTVKYTYYDKPWCFMSKKTCEISISSQTLTIEKDKK